MKKLIVQNIALVTLLTGLANSSLAADLLSPKFYNDELLRCVAVARAALNLPADSQLRHRVTEIHKQGSWYRFTFDTLAIAQDQESAQLATVECRANRFTTAAQLESLDISNKQLTAANQ